MLKEKRVNILGKIGRIILGIAGSIIVILELKEYIFNKQDPVNIFISAVIFFIMILYYGFTYLNKRISKLESSSPKIMNKVDTEKEYYQKILNDLGKAEKSILYDLLENTADDNFLYDDFKNKLMYYTKSKSRFSLVENRLKNKHYLIKIDSYGVHLTESGMEICELLKMKKKK